MTDDRSVTHIYSATTSGICVRIALVNIRLSVVYANAVIITLGIDISALSLDAPSATAGFRRLVNIGLGVTHVSSVAVPRNHCGGCLLLNVCSVVWVWAT